MMAMLALPSRGQLIGTAVAAAATVILLGPVTRWVVGEMSHYRRRRRRRQSQVGQRIPSGMILKEIPSVPGILGVDMGGTLSKVVYLHPKGCLENPLISSHFYGDTGERLVHLQYDCEVCLQGSWVCGCGLS